MPSNRDRIATLLAEIEEGCTDPIVSSLKKHLGAQWRSIARFPGSLAPTADFDAHALLYIVTSNWRDVFQYDLKPEARDAASAAFAGRNKYAHSSGQIDNHLTLRALSGGKDLLEALGATDRAKRIDELLGALILEMSGAAPAPAAAPPPAPPAPKAGKQPAPTTAAAPKPRPTLSLTPTRAEAAPPKQEDFFEGGKVEGLQPWRIVSPPRDDVLLDRLDKDKFAANLAAADRKQGDDTYALPDSFFRATYLTAGLRLTLESAARRLLGEGGPSTLGLQTNFGGGKTHTLLSLLHMARIEDLAKVETLEPVVAALGKSRLGAVSLAVFSGTDKGPDQPLEVVDGSPIRTLWGYLAWRLAGREGLQLVRASEEAGTSPGAEVFQKVLTARDGPALILLDELQAYVRQLGGERYDAHLSFIQSLTEAVSQVPGALLVGSLPESDLEAGGTDKARDTLRALEKVFGRTQSAWQPAQGAETYSVVRRRLFQELDDNGEKQRARTVEAFRKLYRQNKADFPGGVGEADYGERMAEAYPIHPLLFDTLATQWGALEKFQRTRGVLALMARAIYASFRERSQEPLILPSSLRIDDSAVRGALLEPLEGPAWGAIIEGEVDGDSSLPARIEMSRQRYRDDQIARRAARAVFLGSAPSGEARGGLTGPEIRLACVRPGEQLSVFGDALRELAERSSHLYETEGRYWYGTRANLNREAENRQRDIDDEQADEAILAILKRDEGRSGEFGRLHIAPDRASNVEDRPTSGLVVLGPRQPYALGGSSPAEVEALEGLTRRSGGQRRYRNALLFLAPDQRQLEEARRTVKRALAWKSILTADHLDLTASQQQDARERLEQAERAAQAAVRKAWSQLLEPLQDPEDASKLRLEVEGMRPNGQRPVGEAAWDKAKDRSMIASLLGKGELTDRLQALWPADQDDLPVDTLRDWFFEFLHMPRLKDEVVLANAITEAVADLAPGSGGIALAAGKADQGYRDLVFARRAPVSFGSGLLLVRRARAEQIARDTKPDTTPPRPAGGDHRPTDDKPVGDGGSEPPPPRRPTRFSGVLELDPIRGSLRVGQVFEDVIAELDRAPGVSFRIHLEIQAESDDGFPQDVEEIVKDNAGTLGFETKRFD